MPPRFSSISDVTDSAIVFRYKKFANISVFLTIISQIGIIISNSSFEHVYDKLDDNQQDIIYYATIAPQLLSPILAGYLLDKKYYRQVLIIAFLITVAGQTFITISSALSPLNFGLIIAGRILYAIGFAMAIPSLVRFVLMWLAAEKIPMGIASLFVVEILSSTVGILLYNITLKLEQTNLWLTQAIALGACAISLLFASVLYYLDHLANIKDMRDINIMMQPPPPNFRKLFSMPFLLWGTLISAAATLATIYVFQSYQLSLIYTLLDIEDNPYYNMIFNLLTMIALPIFAKFVRVEKQKLKLLVLEQGFAIIGFILLASYASWAVYIPGLSILAITQAGLYLTYFILMLSVMKWEMIGIMIGLFYAFRNSLIFLLENSEIQIFSYLEDKGISPLAEYREFVLFNMAITLLLGLMLSGITYLMNRKKRSTETGGNSITGEDYTRSDQNRMSLLSDESP